METILLIISSILLLNICLNIYLCLEVKKCKFYIKNLKTYIKILDYNQRKIK